MKKNRYLLSFFIVLLVLVVGIIWLRSPEDTWICEQGSWVKHGNPNSQMPNTGCGDQAVTQNDIEVFYPLENDSIISPLEITGRARGSWYFEGSFPVQLTTVHGLVLGNTKAQAQSDWTSDEFVPFTATLEFTLPEGVNQAELIFEKDNPSGLTEHGDEFRVPITLGAQ
jgi:hypothetical protein